MEIVNHSIKHNGVLFKELLEQLALSHKEVFSLFYNPSNLNVDFVSKQLRYFIIKVSKVKDFKDYPFINRENIGDFFCLTAYEKSVEQKNNVFVHNGLDLNLFLSVALKNSKTNNKYKFTDIADLFNLYVVEDYERIKKENQELRQMLSQLHQEKMLSFGENGIVGNLANAQVNNVNSGEIDENFVIDKNTPIFSCDDISAYYLLNYDLEKLSSLKLLKNKLFVVNDRDVKNLYEEIKAYLTREGKNVKQIGSVINRLSKDHNLEDIFYAMEIVRNKKGKVKNIIAEIKFFINEKKNLS